MSGVVPLKGTLDAQAHSIVLRQSMLITLVVCIVVHASTALADDQPLTPDRKFIGEAQNLPRTEVGSAASFAAPFASLMPLSEPQKFSATEFRPRKRNILQLESGSGRSSLLDAPMLKSNQFFQHMSDFKSQGRVRLLTLWQLRGSSLSLQAGKHGSPSLQWSTPWIHREGAARGLFDRLLPLPQHAFGGNARGSMPHLTISAPTQSRTLELAPGSNTK
ncbi:MAG: hypothetical protein M3O26_11915 [Pseudomonadota bacterium]|nr:hypothetical protein [Pseudomonadota bacterium]